MTVLGLEGSPTLAAKSAARMGQRALDDGEEEKTTADPSLRLPPRARKARWGPKPAPLRMTVLGLGFVISHPCGRERRKDGARGTG